LSLAVHVKENFLDVDQDCWLFACPLFLRNQANDQLGSCPSVTDHLAEKLKMPGEDLMRQCNGKVSPSKALVKGVAKELGIDETYLETLAAEVRKDLGSC
jgi:hypothetical protein